MTINMKKHSAFDNIPTLPRTFSGQWMTFSHMANHYRKLLNVKPRVDTGIPHPLAADERKILAKQAKYKSTLKLDRPSTTTECKPKSKWTRPRLTSASQMTDYNDYRAFSHGLMHSPNGSFIAGSSCSDGYQVVFGPSSIKSSVDAMISDQDGDPHRILEPKVSSISIGEKIRKFLDNIHAQESQLRLAGSRPLQSSRERKVPSAKPKEMKPPTESSARTNRHSKCFAPFEVSSPGTKKRPAKHCSGGHSTTDSPLRRPTSIESRRAKITDSPKANKRPLTTSSTTRKGTSTKKSAYQDVFPTAGNNGLSLGSRLARKTSKKRMNSPNMSPRSVSVGTIHGSEELVEEFMVPSPSLPRNLSTIQIDTSDIPADWLKERVERGVVRINNAYFSLAPGTSTSSLGIHHHHHPNKDSSRDSAYGFSSGESRITTRESTPEKKKSKTTRGAGGSGSGHEFGSGSNVSHGQQQYKSSLSTVASSVNQDNDSSSPSHVAHSSGRSSCSEKSIISPNYVPNRSGGGGGSRTRLKPEEKQGWTSEPKYIRFLTKVTDDIVTRGIYTNKGIKNIFKSHIMKNNELEMDKMLYLLERLRMDMGVPKDDSLNQLDFGYGSVDYSTEPFFFKKQEAESTVGGNSSDQPGKDIAAAEEGYDEFEDPTSDENGNSIAEVSS